MCDDASVAFFGFLQGSIGSMPAFRRTRPWHRLIVEYLECHLAMQLSLRGTFGTSGAFKKRCKTRKEENSQPC